MFKKPYKAVFWYQITSYTPKYKNALNGVLKGLGDFCINQRDILRERSKIMPVNYKSQEFFKGKDRQYSRFELKRLCVRPLKEKEILKQFLL